MSGRDFYVTHMRGRATSATGQLFRAGKMQRYFVKKEQLCGRGTPDSGPESFNPRERRPTGAALEPEHRTVIFRSFEVDEG